MIWTISGPSCSGKTTLLEGLHRHTVGAKPIESTTTRKPRSSDLPGEYEYVSEAAFKQLIAENVFLWHVEVHGNYYGTRKANIDRALTLNLYVPLLTLGAVKTLNAYAFLAGKRHRVRSLYLMINDEVELRRRFALRGDWQEDIERRINECRSWNAEAQLLGVRMRFIDASQPPGDVQSAALRLIGEDWRPSKMPLR